MLDKLWEWFTSDDKINRLLMHVGVLAIIAITFVLLHFFGVRVMIGLSALIIVAFVIFAIMSRADKKAEKKYQELLKSEDDGETGYIAVRPDEMDGAPWEVKKKKKKPAENAHHIVPKPESDTEDDEDKENKEKEDVGQQSKQENPQYCGFSCILHA